MRLNKGWVLLVGLPAAQIELLKKWLAQGAQNNSCDENAGGCDVSNAKFSTFIQPLIQVKCQGFHSGNIPQGGVALTSYAEVKSVALNGKLYAAITRTTNWMPKGGPKLDDCSLQKYNPGSEQVRLRIKNKKGRRKIC